MNFNFVKYAVHNGGTLKPLIIPSELTNGTGLFNPSVYVYNDQILVNIRHCQYTLYHSETNKYEHQWGPLLYLNPDGDNTLTTTNYFCLLDSNLEMFEFYKVDTSGLDKKPLWEFVGLEDARIVVWDSKLYLTGVRRDIDTIGTGRMELSQLEMDGNVIKEVARYRIPTPDGDNGYCEKNWMPVLDKPFHYVKWTNPTQVVKCDITSDKVTCDSIFLGEKEELNYDLRGGSQVISYKDGYLALNHITYLYRSNAGRKNATYRHQFTYWDKSWNVIKRSSIFDFMGAKIEFACGLHKYNDSYLITFGFQDNSSYILKVPEHVLEEFVNA